MRDPEDSLWDDYEIACELHRQAISVEERTGKPHPDMYELSLQCFNLMKRCISPEDFRERIDPDHESVLQYIKDHPFSSQEELYEKGMFGPEQLRSAVERPENQLSLEPFGDTMRYWHDIERSKSTKDEVDTIVAIYVEKCYPVQVLVASRHLRIPEYRVRKSLNSQGFPKGQLLNEVMHAITGYYPHGTKVSQTTATGRVNGGAFSNSRKRKRDYS